MRPLTSQQRAVYEFIRDKIISRGYGPTVREIGEHMNIKSPNGVMCHLRALERKGMIARTANKSRAIELTESISSVLGNKLPLSGSISAGTCNLNSSNASHGTQERELPEYLDMGKLVHEHRYLVRVLDDSMSSLAVCAGDLLVVQRQTTAEVGQLAMVANDDSTTGLYKYFPESGRVRLEPTRPECLPIYRDHVSVSGVVVGLVRSMTSQALLSDAMSQAT